MRRWDGSLFYEEPPGFADERAARSSLWEDESGRISAAALSEGGRQIHPRVRPDAAELLETVVAWGETAAAAAGDDSVLLGVWDGAETTALMLEGMRRVFGLGALTIEVGTGDADPATALYASLPFTDERRSHFWAKNL